MGITTPQKIQQTDHKGPISRMALQIFCFIFFSTDSSVKIHEMGESQSPKNNKLRQLNCDQEEVFKQEVNRLFALCLK